MYTIEEFDNAKTRVLKYIIYKKRTEQEVRRKFSNVIEPELLEDVIEYLKETKYIDDKEYIRICVNDFKKLKNLSIWEVKYKLLSKGLEKDEIDDYIYNNSEELEQYEIKSAINIINKKLRNSELEDIKQYLIKKGYKRENVNTAVEEMEM